MFHPVIDLLVDGPDPEPVCVIFPSFPTNWDQTLDRLIADLTNVRLPPCRFLFVCPFGQHEALVRSFKSQNKRLRERLRATSHVAVAAYHDRGEVRDDVFNLWCPSGDAWDIKDDFIQRAARAYIAEVCETTNTILQAPSGYQFRKPSSSTSAVFLRAGNMLGEIDSVNAYSNLLLRRCTERTRTIFIDSFTILSFAMGLREAIVFFGGGEREPPLIENFHSYDKEKGLRFPADDYIVIISASTSGELAHSLVADHGAAFSKIVHLVGGGAEHFDSQFRSSCIYFHSPSHVSRPVALDDIRIGGEEFIPSYGQPRPVRLTVDHITPRHAKIFKDDFYKDNLKLMHSARASGYESYALFSVLNEAHVLGPKEFYDWLVDHLIHEIPATISLVVYLNDEMSKELANSIVKLLPSLRSDNVIAADEVGMHKGELSSGHAVLIVASEDPNLVGFTRASIELRRWPDAYRHFVLGHAFPQAMTDFDRASATLTVRAEGLPKYGWSNFAVAAIGRHDQHLEWLFDYPVDFVDVLDEGIGRTDALLRALRTYASERQVFLPKLDGSRMALRSGSVFFRGEYEQLSDEVVYLAVSTAVQAAREVGVAQSGAGRLVAFRSEVPRFDANPFVGTVIDPSMFSRFSDGILQAALLRCLHPGELDFSGSTVLSGQMRELLLAVLRNATNVVGEAVLEFMAALATDKVKLGEKDTETVVAAVEIDGALSRVWGLFKARPAF